MENTALTNATRSSLSPASDSQLSADSELDVSMIIEKMQHLKSRLKSASDKLEKPVNMCGNMFYLNYILVWLLHFVYCRGLLCPVKAFSVTVMI